MKKTASHLGIFLLVVVAIIMLVPSYCSPVWWVSLTAPNYPEEAFPDGVRIHFHLNGVFNGCEKLEKDEIFVDEAVDCVHEMDTINHYVGMYPIAAGGAIEIAFSLFVLAMLGVMVLGFAIPRAGLRMVVMAIGFAAVATWMAMTWYGDGGLKYHSATYVARLAGDLEEEEPEASQLSSGQALIERLKASMAESAASDKEAQEPAAELAEKSPKEVNIERLEDSFMKDQERLPEGERQAWSGSGSQMLPWYYEKSLGRYFNDPEVLDPMVSKMTKAAHITFWVIIAFMVVFVWCARKNKGLSHYVLILLPMALPALFVLIFAAWLGWYGHTMNDMGAFSLKPFMPTVFGQGKVAQFSTNSYPHYGFAYMCAFTVLLALAGLVRRNQNAREEA